MPSYNVIVKDGVSDEKLAEAKKKATESGGKITKEFNTIKGFTVEVPDDQVNVLSSDDALIVEADGEMRTQ